MNDSNHVLEELRSMRGAHVDLMGKMSDVCGEVRELIVELRHTQRNYDGLNDRTMKIEDAVRGIQIENATNKPIMDIAKRMYWSQWATIVAAVGGTAGVNWPKIFGG